MEFEKILEERKQHKISQVFMNYLTSGGNVKILRACTQVEKTSFKSKRKIYLIIYLNFFYFMLLFISVCTGGGGTRGSKVLIKNLRRPLKRIRT